MATLADTIDIQPTTQNPDFEPDEEWKNNLRQHIEVSLKPQVELLKREFNEKRKGLPPPYNSRTQTDYDNAMAGLRRKAAEEYCQLLERERQERRFAAGEKVDEKWSEIFLKEQQALLDLYKKDRLTINPRRSFTDESRQPPRWFPPPRTSDPRPTKSKSSFRADNDGDFPFQPSSPVSGPKHYPGDEESVSDGKDDSEDDWRQRLEAEFSRRECNVKQMEEEVARWKEETRKKEAELKAKEAELLRKEEEARRNEEAARVREEDVRMKVEGVRKREAELRRKERDVKRQEEDARRKEEEAREMEEEARKKEEELERKEDEMRQLFELVEQKEEDVRQMEVDIRTCECGSSNGRDRSVNFALPPAPEIREPPLNISSHALEYSSRKRGSGADNDTATSSSSRHSSGDMSGGTSIGFDMGEVNAKLHPRPTVLVAPPTVSPSPPVPFHQPPLARPAGSFLSSSVAHNTTLGPPSGRPKMLQSASDDEKEERIHQIGRAHV